MDKLLNIIFQITDPFETYVINPINTVSNFIKENAFVIISIVLSLTLILLLTGVLIILFQVSAYLAFWAVTLFAVCIGCSYIPDFNEWYRNKNKTP